MSEQPASTREWTVIGHLNYGTHGTVVLITHRDGRTVTTAYPAGDASGLAAHCKPVFLGVAGNRALIMDAESKAISRPAALPVDAFPAYAYPDPVQGHLWYTNDGDKEHGVDPLNCGDCGSSVTVIATGTDPDEPAKWLRTLCVGRGHHVVAFAEPCAADADIPRRAFVSNLIDGTISVVDNDPRSDKFLSVLDTVSLLDSDQETDPGARHTGNSAFPHGMVFSPATGRLYNLNNGYHTVVALDPRSGQTLAKAPMPVSSNLLLHPRGEFLIGKGADRKSDAQHVIGRLTVMNARSLATEEIIELPDIYPSTYRFNHDGNRLYVTTAATGKAAQRDNLRKRVLLIYDAGHLPKLSLLREVEIGLADCGRRPLAMLNTPAGTERLFIPNPTDGTLSILSAEGDTLETVTVGAGHMKEWLFSFWNNAVTGC